MEKLFYQIPRTKVLAIAHPDWLGIRSSSQEMFNEHIYIGDVLDERKAAEIAMDIADNVSDAVVIQAFPLNYTHLVLALKKYAPDIPLYCIWHGSFLQSNEKINWKGFKIICDFARKKYFRRIAFVKQGMSEIMWQQRIPAFFLKNFVNAIPQKAATSLQDALTHCAVWSSTWCWRKPPYAMLAAVGFLPGTLAHLYGTNDEINEFIKELNIPCNVASQPVHWQNIRDEYRKMHINLYVTMSECAPMVPLESLSCGVPCLFGPNNHYFEDNSYLYDRLVVRIPDSAHLISQYLQRALDERENIIDEYIKYAPSYNEECKYLLQQFLKGE